MEGDLQHFDTLDASSTASVSTLLAEMIGGAGAMPTERTITGLARSKESPIVRALLNEEETIARGGVKCRIVLRRKNLWSGGSSTSSTGAIEFKHRSFARIDELHETAAFGRLAVWRGGPVARPQSDMRDGVWIRQEAEPAACDFALMTLDVCWRRVR